MRALWLCLSVSLAAASLTPSAALAQHMNQSDAPCQNVGPDALTTQCFYEAFQAADRRLTAKIEEIDHVLDQQGRADLQAAQSAWLTYRDATCSAEYHLFGGGSGGPMARSACLEAQTRDRLADLQKTYDWRLEKVGR